MPLIDVEQRIAIGTCHALGLVWRDQFQRSTAIRAAHRSGRHATRFAFRRTRTCQTDVREWNLLAKEDPRRLQAVVDRAERAILTGEVGVTALFIRRQLIRYLTVGG